MTHDHIAIIQGRAADYDALARFHYRAPRPAVCVRTLTACDQSTGEVVGVLTVSMPTLNGPWRAEVWPRLFANLSKRDLARRVNTNLRTISRVIIDPRYRALGLARRLVQAYLAAPLTRCTEAVAAMGRWSPFFAHAGMHELAMTRARRDWPLAQVIRSLAIEPWELIETSRAASVVQASPRLREALFSWAGASRATRRFLFNLDPTDETLTMLAVHAGATLTAKPLVYVADEQWGSS